MYVHASNRVCGEGWGGLVSQKCVICVTAKVNAYAGNVGCVCKLLSTKFKFKLNFTCTRYIEYIQFYKRKTYILKNIT